MKTYYEEKDMQSFGEYLLSKKRADLILSRKSPLSDAERLTYVYHADFENWKHLNQQAPEPPFLLTFNNN